MLRLSNEPYVGCRDYLPDDFKKLKYVIDKWREVALRYGYKEYLTPVLEYADIYEAKSGEDIKKELFYLIDSGGRKLALRPEMTPSVTRLVTKIYEKEPKPIRLFSIANFFRGEKPQKGRYREFWQLNLDIFGSTSIYADLEILLSVFDMMEAFNAPQNSYILKINHRKLIEYFITKILEINDPALKVQLIRKLDKYEKITQLELETILYQIGLSSEQINKVIIWMSIQNIFDLIKKFPDIEQNEGFKEIVFLIESVQKQGYYSIVYSSSLIRGFDYYDGMIFEVFDNSKKFKRSLFGGGRYNGLASIFGKYNIPAVGYAPGSPIMIFLDNWNLWPLPDKNNKYYFPLISQNYINESLSLLSKLRFEKLMDIEMSDTTISLKKALSYANKKNFDYVIIYGENEIKQKKYIIKDMKNGTQEVVKIF